MGYKFSPWSGSKDPICLQAQKKQNIKQKQYCNKVSKDLKNRKILKSKNKKIFKKSLSANRLLGSESVKINNKSE